MVNRYQDFKDAVELALELCKCGDTKELLQLALDQEALYVIYEQLEEG